MAHTPVVLLAWLLGEGPANPPRWGRGGALDQWVQAMQLWPGDGPEPSPVPALETVAEPVESGLAVRVCGAKAASRDRTFRQPTARRFPTRVAPARRYGRGTPSLAWTMA